MWQAFFHWSRDKILIDLNKTYVILLWLNPFWLKSIVTMQQSIQMWHAVYQFWNWIEIIIIKGAIIWSACDMCVCNLEKAMLNGNYIMCGCSITWLSFIVIRIMIIHVLIWIAPSWSHYKQNSPLKLFLNILYINKICKMKVVVIYDFNVFKCDPDDAYINVLIWIASKNYPTQFFSVLTSHVFECSLHFANGNNVMRCCYVIQVINICNMVCFRVFVRTDRLIYLNAVYITLTRQTNNSYHDSGSFIDYYMILKQLIDVLPIS